MTKRMGSVCALDCDLTTYEEAGASIGHPIRKGETFGEWFERAAAEAFIL